MHDYSYYLQTLGEIGEVIRVKHPLITVEGLPHAKLSELVLFESGQMGQIFSIDYHTSEVVLLSQSSVKVGDVLVRTDSFPSIPVDNTLLGRVINPLGYDLSTEEPVEGKENRVIETMPLGIGKRARIKKFFATGVSIVDMMVPLGKGQKELIIGDRKTGKSSFVLTAMKRQALEKTVIIYAAIGKKNSEIKTIEEKIVQDVGKENCILIATTSTDSPGLIYFTPFAAMTVAEYFRDKGNDVLLILDDLSTHAKFYREIALIAKNFPGRDSYPGDIFYTHARLLERAGNFTHMEKGEVAITCLPLAETAEGDLSGFISTNLMGITDGHIFFDSELFYKGRRPGINSSLSVSRVGKQTQTKAARSVTREITSFLALYEKVQNLSHFGSELNDNVKRILSMGERLYLFFDQQTSFIMPEDIQLLLFTLIWLNDPNVQPDTIESVRSGLIKAYEAQETKKFLHELLEADSLNDLLGKVQKDKERIYALWLRK